jgi:hypothetical protein
MEAVEAQKKALLYVHGTESSKKRCALCMIAITLKIRSAPRLLQVLRDRKKLELRPRVYLVPSSAVFCILIPERIHHLLVWYGGAIVNVVSYVLLCAMYIGVSSKQKATNAAPQQQRLRRRHHK